MRCCCSLGVCVFAGPIPVRPMAISLRSPAHLVDLNQCIRLEVQTPPTPAPCVSSLSAAPPALHSMQDVRASLESLQRKQRDKARKRQTSYTAKLQQKNQPAATSKPNQAQHKPGRKPSAARARTTGTEAALCVAASAATAAASSAPVPAAPPTVLLSPTSFSRLLFDPSSLSLSAIQSLHAALHQQILHEMKVELAPEQRFDDVIKQGFEEIEREHQKQQQHQQQTTQQQPPQSHVHASLQAPSPPNRAAWSPPKPCHPAPLRMHRRNSSGGGSGMHSPGGLVSPGTRSPLSTASSSASPMPSFRPPSLSVNVLAARADGFVSPPLSTHPLSSHAMTPTPSWPASTRSAATTTPSTPAYAASRAQMRLIMQQRAHAQADAAHAQQLAAHPVVQQLTALLSPKGCLQAASAAVVAPADSPPPRISSPLYAVGGGLHRFDRFLNNASATPTPAAAASPAVRPSRHTAQRCDTPAEDDSSAVMHHLNRSASRSGDVASPFGDRSPIPPPYRSTWSPYAPSDAAPPTGTLASPMPSAPLPQPPASADSLLPPSAHPSGRQWSAGKRRNYRVRSPAITPSSADTASRSPSFNETPQATPPMHRSLAFPFLATHDSTSIAAGSTRTPDPAFRTPEPISHASRVAPITPASAPSFVRASIDFNLSASQRAAPHLSHPVSLPAVPDAAPRPADPLVLFKSPSSTRPSSSWLPRSPAQPRPPSLPARPQSESVGKRAHVAQARAMAAQHRGARSQTAATVTSHARIQRMRPANNHAAASNVAPPGPSSPGPPSALKLSNWTQSLSQPTPSDETASIHSSSTHRSHPKQPLSIETVSSAAATHWTDASRRSPAAGQAQPQPLPQSLLSPTAAAAAAAAQHVAGRVAAERRLSAPQSPAPPSLSSPGRSSGSLLPLYLPPALSASPSSVSMQAIAEGDEVAAALHSARIAQGLASGSASSGGGSAHSFTPNGSARPPQLGSVIFRSQPHSSLRSSVGSSLSDSPRSLRNSFDAPFVVEHAHEYAEEEVEGEGGAEFGEELPPSSPFDETFHLHRGLEHDAIPFPSASDMAAEDAYLSDSSG